MLSQPSAGVLSLRRKKQAAWERAQAAFEKTFVPRPATNIFDAAQSPAGKLENSRAFRTTYFFRQAFFLVAFLAVLVVFLAAFLVAITRPPFKKVSGRVPPG